MAHERRREDARDGFHDRNGGPPRRRRGETLSEEEQIAIADPIRAKYAEEGSPYYSTARLWDDGIIDPTDTCAVIGLCIAASLNAPIPETAWPVFRM